MAKTFVLLKGKNKLLLAECPGGIPFYAKFKNQPHSVFLFVVQSRRELRAMGQFTYQHNISDTTWFQGFLLIQQIS